MGNRKEVKEGGFFGIFPTGMDVFTLDQNCDISIFASHRWTFSPHRHDFYELAYILGGRGRHVVNGQGYPYQTGDIFLLLPGDVHTFDVRRHTRFCLVVFHKVFLSQAVDPNGGETFLNTLEKVLSREDRHVRGLIKKAVDLHRLRETMDVLIDEIRGERWGFETLAKNGLLSVLVLMARGLTDRWDIPRMNDRQGAPVMDILNHIHRHAADQRMMRLEVLAEKCHMSKNYLGQYFKKKTGRTLRDYILRYRLNLARHRLRYTSDTASQIASDLDFTDPSHLNRMFRRTFGLSPRAFRQNARR
jgi:AraC family transcriptional regulator, L-rhamnose operon regulatory protein RhaS